MWPPPFRQDCSRYKQASFSPTTIKLAERSKSILSMKIAKMILLGDCGVGKSPCSKVTGYLSLDFQEHIS